MEDAPGGASQCNLQEASPHSPRGLPRELLGVPRGLVRSGGRATVLGGAQDPQGRVPRVVHCRPAAAQDAGTPLVPYA